MGIKPNPRIGVGVGGILPDDASYMMSCARFNTFPESVFSSITSEHKSHRNINKHSGIMASACSASIPPMNSCQWTNYAVISFITVTSVCGQILCIYKQNQLIFLQQRKGVEGGNGGDGR